MMNTMNAFLEIAETFVAIAETFVAIAEINPIKMK